MERPRHKRIVVDTPSGSKRRPASRQQAPGPRESIIAVTVIAAAMLATFLALFLTSRPYDPMDSTVNPQQAVPQIPITVSPSPKPSPTTTPGIQTAPAGQTSESANETKPAVIDDATIQAEIERTIASDSTFSKLDLSTIVEGGKVTLVGSVKSPDLKQRVEKAVRSVKGVVSVDNQLVITEATP
jgi:hypothetical protein